MTDTKRQPLPWFAFNVGEYVKDTMRLSRDAHGAYLLLMLDYYGTASPCPDDDFILAALTKSTDAEWKQLRKVLAPFFDIREGHWYHKRIEREMQEACERHAASTAQASAAAHARWEKERAEKGAKPAKRRQITAKAPKNAGSNADSNAGSTAPAMPEQCSSDAHKQKHPSYNRGGEEAPAPIDDDEGIGTPVPTDFRPDDVLIAVAHEHGITDEDLAAEVRKFIAKRQDEGAFSHNWQASFQLWLDREIAFRRKQAKPKAPPRIEVNNQPAEIPEAEWDRAVALWKRDNSKWSRQLGAEPGMGGCRVPRAILEKHGLDPQTGMPVRRAS